MIYKKSTKKFTFVENVDDIVPVRFHFQTDQIHAMLLTILPALAPGEFLVRKFPPREMVVLAAGREMDLPIRTNFFCKAGLDCQSNK